jgi:hypothetical protein
MRCAPCHAMPPVNHAPFPLVQYTDVLADDPIAPYPGIPIWKVMHTVIQSDGEPHMPFGNAPQLSSSQFATLNGWLTNCAVPVAAAGK